MTVEEALKITETIDLSKLEISGNAKYIANWGRAVETLREKQIPKKPKKVHKEALVKKRIFDWECSCGRLHRNDFPLNYCSECGQKIDWEEVEE